MQNKHYKQFYRGSTYVKKKKKEIQNTKKKKKNEHPNTKLKEKQNLI